MERTRIARKWLWVVPLAVVVAAGFSWWLWRPRAAEVQLASVTRTTLSNQVFASGLIKPEERQVIMPGTLAVQAPTYHVKVGAMVVHGQVLLSAPNQPQVTGVQAAESALQTAEQSLSQAQSQYNQAPLGLQPQFRGTVVSAKSAVAQAKAQLAQAQAALQATEVVAQFDGQVLMENPSGIASDGTTAPWMEVVGGGKEAAVDVSEVDAAQLRPGMHAAITSDAYPNRKWQATVATVSPYATVASSGSGQVEIDLTLPHHFPVPYNYQVNVNIVSATSKRVPVVPYDALVQQGDSYAVFVYRRGHVYQQPVTLGLTGNASVEVRSGLHPGDRIVLNPPTAMHSGQAVRVR